MDNDEYVVSVYLELKLIAAAYCVTILKYTMAYSVALSDFRDILRLKAEFYINYIMKKYLSVCEFFFCRYIRNDSSNVMTEMWSEYWPK